MTELTSCYLLASCLCLLFWLSLTQHLPLDHPSVGGGPTIQQSSSSRRCRSFSVQFAPYYEDNIVNATNHHESASSSSSSWTVPLHKLSPLEGFQQSTCMVCPNADGDSSFGTGRTKFKTLDGNRSSSARNLGNSRFGTTTATSTMGGVHVVVFMGPNHPAVEKIMIVAAGLLTEGHRVTMIAGPNLRPELSLQVSSALYERIPCDRQGMVQNNFRYLGFNIPSDTQLPCRNYQQPLTDPTVSPGDFILCSTQNSLVFAQGLLVALQSLQYNPLDRADLLLMDATYIPGLLVAEYSLVPSLVVMDEARDLKHILGHVVGMSPLTSPYHSISPSWGWLRMWQFILERFTSFELTSVFMALNKARSSMGLRRLRRLAYLWMAPGSIMIATTTPLGSAASSFSYYHQVNQQDLPNLLILTSPILPPCVSCSASLPIVRPTTSGDSNNNQTIPALVITIGYPNRPQGRRRSRLIVQGMSLARASIQQYVQNCRDKRGGDVPYTLNGTTPLDEEESFTCPWQGPPDFYVIQAGSSLEVLLPPFIVPETYEFMDTMCRHKSIALISLCDARNTGTHSIGLPIVCFEDQWTAHDLAREVLRVISKEQPHHHRSNQANETGDQPNSTAPPLLDLLHNDGMAWMVSLAERTAQITRERQHKWKNGWEMGQDVLKSLNLLAPMSGDLKNTAAARRWQQQYHVVHSVFVIYLAWVVIVSCFLYIVYNAALEQQHPSTASRLRRSLQHRAPMVVGSQLSMSSILADVIARLPELDRLRTLWTHWWTENMYHLEDTESMANLLARPISIVLNSKDFPFTWGSGRGGGKEGTTANGANNIRKQRKTAKNKRH